MIAIDISCEGEFSSYWWFNETPAGDNKDAAFWGRIFSQDAKIGMSQNTVEVGSLHTLRVESLKLVFQPLHKFLVNKL